MPDETTRRVSKTKHHHHRTAEAHPALKWIIALIVGLASSILLMLLIVAGLIEQAGGVGEGTLVFKSFFAYTGGLVLLQSAGESMLMFVLATLYYFLFFTLFGLILGLIVQWLIRIIRRD